MLKWYKSQRNQIGGDIPVAEVITGLEINYSKKNNMKISIRLVLRYRVGLRMLQTLNFVIYIILVYYPRGII